MTTVEASIPPPEEKIAYSPTPAKMNPFALGAQYKQKLKHGKPRQESSGGAGVVRASSRYVIVAPASTLSPGAGSMQV